MVVVVVVVAVGVAVGVAVVVVVAVAVGVVVGVAVVVGVVVAVSRLIAAKMPEAELEEHIRQLALGLGILRFHVRDARGMTPGFPDDLLIGPAGLLWRENKTMTGKLTPDQRAVGKALRALGQQWDIWRPADLISGRIARELAAITAVKENLMRSFHVKQFATVTCSLGLLIALANFGLNIAGQYLTPLGQQISIGTVAFLFGAVIFGLRIRERHPGILLRVSTINGTILEADSQHLYWSAQFGEVSPAGWLDVIAGGPHGTMEYSQVPIKVQVKPVMLRVR